MFMYGSCELDADERIGHRMMRRLTLSSSIAAAHRSFCVTYFFPGSELMHECIMDVSLALNRTTGLYGGGACWLRHDVANSRG